MYKRFAVLMTVFVLVVTSFGCATTGPRSLQDKLAVKASEAGSQDSLLLQERQRFQQTLLNLEGYDVAVGAVRPLDYYASNSSLYGGLAGVHAGNFYTGGRGYGSQPNLILSPSDARGRYPDSGYFQGQGLGPILQERLKLALRAYSSARVLTPATGSGSADLSILQAEASVGRDAYDATQTWNTADWVLLCSYADAGSMQGWLSVHGRDLAYTLGARGWLRRALFTSDYQRLTVERAVFLQCSLASPSSREELAMTVGYGTYQPVRVTSQRVSGVSFGSISSDGLGEMAAAMVESAFRR